MFLSKVIKHRWIAEMGIELAYLSIPGWFIVGVATAFGPCLGHHIFILLPYLALAGKDVRHSLMELVAFSAARIGTYAGMGMLAGSTGLIFARWISSPMIFSMARGGLGIVLCGVAVTVLLRENNTFCRFTSKFFTNRSGRAMALSGFFTALVPCPVLLGLFTYSSASGEILYGFASGAAFAAGTTISPLLVMAPVCTLVKKKTAGNIKFIVRFGGGLFLFGYGLHLVIGGFFTR